MFMAVRSLSLLAAILVAIPTWSSAEDVVVQDFLTCSGITQDSVRLACYDNASSEFEQEPMVDAAPTEARKEISTEVAEVVAVAATVPVEVQEEAPVQAQEETPVEAAEVTAVAVASKEDPSVVPLTDEVGLSALERDVPETTIRATVTDCQLDARGKYNFYFDNGQVWKQTDGSRSKYTDCDFAVSITKDGFGYRMVPDGGKRKIRISRIK